VVSHIQTTSCPSRLYFLYSDSLVAIFCTSLPSDFSTASTSIVSGTALITSIVATVIGVSRSAKYQGYFLQSILVHSLMYRIISAVECASVEKKLQKDFCIGANSSCTGIILFALKKLYTCIIQLKVINQNFTKYVRSP